MNNPQQCENRFRNEDGYEVQCEKEASLVVDAAKNESLVRAAKDEIMKPGTQIIYVPTHAGGDIHHPDCEAGFVAHETILPGNAIFCRYWANGSAPRRLRTLANSEATPIEYLVIRDTVPFQDIEVAMVKCGIKQRKE